MVRRIDHSKVAKELDELREYAQRIKGTQSSIPGGIRRAIAAGATWTEIALVLGYNSRQAAWERWHAEVGQ